MFPFNFPFQFPFYLFNFLSIWWFHLSNLKSTMRRYFLNSNPTPALQEPPPPPPPQLVLQDSSITAAAEPNASGQTPLSAIVDAFEDLAKLLKSITDQDNDVDRGELQLDVFCDSCSPVSVLFSCLGLAFKFAESEYVAKVHSFSSYSDSYSFP